MKFDRQKLIHRQWIVFFCDFSTRLRVFRQELMRYSESNTHWGSPSEELMDGSIRAFYPSTFKDTLSNEI